MKHENSETQERFSELTPKEGDILRVVRTGPKDGYNVEFVNQSGFKVLNVPKGTEVVLGSTYAVSSGMAVQGHGDIKGFIGYKDGVAF